MAHPFQNKKIGLALGGGAALGAAHIGVLKALQEHNVQVDIVAGTSIGALVGALFAFGVSIPEMEQTAQNMKWLEVASISPSRYALLTNKRMAKLLENNIGKVSFAESSLPLAMVATDIANGEKVVLNEGSIEQAVMASTCIPGVFAPVDLEGRLLVDGGIVENVPISPVKAMGADIVIAVDLISGGSQQKPDHILDVMVNSFYFLMHTISELQTETADVLIKPDLSEYSMTSMDNAAELIEAGYLAANQVLNGL